MLEFLYAAVAFHRASHDAGFWMIDRKGLGHYLDALFITKGWI